MIRAHKSVGLQSEFNRIAVIELGLGYLAFAFAHSGSVMAANVAKGTQLRRGSVIIPNPF